MPTPDTAPLILSVSELNRQARLALERSLQVAWIAGEISNLTRAPSGHWYFTLKDAQASVRCAMFRNRNQFLDWRPENGMQVEVRAQATLYEPRGEFQLTVDALRRAGLGALYEAFLRLKEKLEAEGLFDPARKRRLPDMPACIGVITSPRAAALRDVLTTLRRRWPLAHVLIYPTLVQGTEAPGQIVAALDVAAARRECEVVLLVRGGGSLEDLWAFNDEAVARAIARSPMPVVSGVGHETDFTIADFAADLRAPTPTGAAQLATPDGAAWRDAVARQRQRLHQALRRRLDQQAQHLDGLARRLQHPAARLQAQTRLVEQWLRRLVLAQQAGMARRRHRFEPLAARLEATRPDIDRARDRVAALSHRLRLGLDARLAAQAARLASLEGQLRHLNPDAVLERGYGIVRDDQGRIVRNADTLNPGDRLTLTLAQGSATANVTKTFH